MNVSIEAITFDMNVAGRKIDGRTMEAKRFRSIGLELADQLGRNPSASERLLLMNTATLAMLCEQATADLLASKAVDQENYRRNVTLLGANLIKLGLAKKSRDVSKRDSAGMDDFGAALIEVNAGIS
ncbi:hypothetical protein [Sphingomonas endophytica]|uniref:hypothetical protein n=1 Tax=Sphingomonas endophytica TaxID=869719 RepID=UPI0016082F46|nr:hypothetical protein [Sphingomonas endophytica]